MGPGLEIVHEKAMFRFEHLSVRRFNVLRRLRLLSQKSSAVPLGDSKTP
jgi:hypothetical protein